MTDLFHRQPFQRLPEELVQDVLERLSHRDHAAFSLASHWCYQAAIPVIWRDVTLQDRLTEHEDDSEDHHDDTPLLRKLLIIATKPTIGAAVQALTHRCHLPTPDVREELRKRPFSGMMLSPDTRTTKLIQLAVKNMPNVHTLRIVFGHPNINDALVRSFFDRNRTPSIRHLWLENCRISAAWEYTINRSSLAVPLHLDFSGLQSIRLRRLPLRSTYSQDWPAGPQLVYSRFPSTNRTMRDELGNSCKRTGEYERVRNGFRFVNRCDDNIYRTLAQEMNLPPEVAECEPGTSDEERAELAARRHLIDIDWLVEQQPEYLNHFPHHHEIPSSAQVALGLLHSCSATLTNLCLDSVLTKPLKTDMQADLLKWHDMFERFFSLRFPHLRSFQARTDFVQDESLPRIYLLDYSELLHKRTSGNTSTGPSLCALDFMEAHPNLQCLAWPLDRFFASTNSNPAIAARVEAVTDKLGPTLVDLRVNAKSGQWQQQPKKMESVHDQEARRRRFITDFAANMTQVQRIKIEGGVPRDESREILRALHRCSLSKIVIAGVESPVGNTWGAGGEELVESLDHLDDFDTSTLQAEHADSIHAIGSQPLSPPAANFTFTPVYGWPPGPPMLHTLASFYASTLKELKLCGPLGAPHCHALESLTLTMWLPTEFEERHRGDDIIGSWLDARNARDATLSLLSVRSSYEGDDEEGGWDEVVASKYAPVSLAAWVTEYIGSLLSERAKAREGGVNVRVRMHVGDGPGIFDIDMRIAKDGAKGVDVCLGFTGPREEFEVERRMGKLRSRRWFGRGASLIWRQTQGLRNRGS
ncbi:hypothetical protein BDY17DRAFT_320801 [Neohortaea acidophila]|uniref:Uncharacterized protein n=1 Tax=Neohortaea acidophila TaxID=245834 RepID=A0A6A6Q133_9PEZI|nr:uncharacterized protein BDY17DRAFT_320801 [Neohortaea acidophila]KAF2485965.1 hypothetical protein BDY17DRAFT_320801 [Neohortaea acidophila]